MTLPKSAQSGSSKVSKEIQGAFKSFEQSLSQLYTSHVQALRDLQTQCLAEYLQTLETHCSKTDTDFQTTIVKEDHVQLSVGDCSGDLESSLTHGKSIVTSTKTVQAKIVADDVASLTRAQSDYLQSVRTDVQRWQLRTAFEALCTICILTNTVVIGCEMDSALASEDFIAEPWYGVIEPIFTCWFVLELLIRLGLNGAAYFCPGPGFEWNMFDTAIVSFDVIDMVLVRLSNNTNMFDVSTLRTLRLFRALRGLRIIRAVRFQFFDGLRLMVLSLAKCAGPTFWAGMILAMVVYMFSLFFMQAVLIHLMQTDWYDSESEALRKKFCTIRRSMLTLLQTVSGGTDWKEDYDLVSKMGDLPGFVFVCYVIFTAYGIGNIITGVFVDGALGSARNDHDEMIHERIARRHKTVLRLGDIFEKADRDSNGHIDAAELHQHLLNMEVRAALDALGLEVVEAERLFQALDSDLDGVVRIEEFISGMIRMTGAARSQDLLLFMSDQQQQSAVIIGKQQQQSAMILGKLDAIVQTSADIYDMCRGKTARLQDGVGSHSSEGLEWTRQEGTTRSCPRNSPQKTFPVTQGRHEILGV